MSNNYKGIIDNINWSLGDQIPKILEKNTKEVKISVGYFYIKGLKPFLNKDVSIKILVGQIGEDAGETIKKSILNQIKSLRVDEDNKNLVKYLYEGINSGQIEFKVHNKLEKFHPKMYYIESSNERSSRAIVGSSNLTDGGLRKNIELNIEVENQITLNELDKWFNKMWNKSNDINPSIIEEAIVKTDFKDIIRPKYPTVPDGSQDDIISPKLATKLYIAGQERERIRNETLFGEISDLDQLTEFQQDAVKVGDEILKKYGGVIVSDSVGLGKSYIGAGLLQNIDTNNTNNLVIGPKSLKNKWMNEIFGDKFNNIRVDFLTISKLSIMEKEDLNELANYNNVIIDEGHHFKNRDSSAYKNLNTISKNKNLIILTATPIHNSVSDFDSIRRLFADTHDFDFKSMTSDLDKINENPYITDISNVFKKYEKINDKTDMSDEDLELKNEIEEVIRRVIGSLVIIRDRDYIKENYPDATLNNKKISFPERNIHSIEINNEDLEELVSDIKLTIIGSNIEDKDTGLNYPSIIPYIIPDRKNISNRLQQINMLRRLDSSINAFIKSVERLQNYNNSLLDILNEDTYKNLDTSKLDIILEKHRKQIGKKDKKDLYNDIKNIKQADKKILKEELKEDIKSLNKILDKMDNSSAKGKKAEKLRGEILMSDNNKSGKYLVFSEYKDTVKHIFEYLTGDNINKQVSNITSTDYTVGVITGDTDNNKKIIKRFAPSSNDNDSIDYEDEIDVLVSTEVFSEGQDAQDADTIINYDIHWNPMRIEQRIGRIDRLDSKFDDIHIHNFKPIDGIESSIEILKLIRGKLSRVANLIGKSNPIVMEDGPVKRQLDLYKKVKNDESKFGSSKNKLLEESASDTYNKSISILDEMNVNDYQTVKNILNKRDESNNLKYTIPYTESLDENYLLLDIDIKYSDGSIKPESILIESDSMSCTESLVPGESVSFESYKRGNDNPSRILSDFSSIDDSRYDVEISKVEEKLIENIESTDLISNSDNDITSTEQNIGNLCNKVRNNNEFNEDIKSTARSIRDKMMDQNIKFSDNSITALRGKYNTVENEYNNPSDKINEINNLIESDKIQYAEPRYVENINIRTIGKILGEN